MIKFTVVQKKPFEPWQFGKIGVLVNFIIDKLKFCKIAHVFSAPVSLVRGKFEKIKRKFKTEKSRFQPYRLKETLWPITESDSESFLLIGLTTEK